MVLIDVDIGMNSAPGWWTFGQRRSRLGGIGGAVGCRGSETWRLAKSWWSTVCGGGSVESE